MAIDIGTLHLPATGDARAGIAGRVGILVGKGSGPAVIGAALVSAACYVEPDLDLFVVNSRFGHAAGMAGGALISQGDGVFLMRARRSRSGASLIVRQPVRASG